MLFLDEAPEFDRGVLDALRQPLETGDVRIDRSSASATYPARFQLVLAANPCPCGRSNGKGEDCRCTPAQRRAYFGKLSGPLLDRVDLRLQVPALSYAELTAGQTGSPAQTWRAEWPQLVPSRPSGCDLTGCAPMRSSRPPCSAGPCAAPRP